MVLLDPQRMVIDEVVLCEDGHAQERSLLNQVVPLLEPSDLLIADRNFDMRAFLFGIKRQKPALSFENMGEWPHTLRQ